MFLFLQLTYNRKMSDPADVMAREAFGVRSYNELSQQQKQSLAGG